MSIKLVIYKPQNCLKALFLPFRNEIFKQKFYFLHYTQQICLDTLNRLGCVDFPMYELLDGVVLVKKSMAHFPVLHWSHSE